MTIQDKRRQHLRFSVSDTSTNLKDEGFEIDGISAQVRKDDLKGKLFGFSGEKYRVVNLSRGGLAFEMDKVFKNGQRVLLLLYLPGQVEPFELHSKVCWQKDILSKYVLNTIGVQFFPFGEEKGMNPVRAYEVLVELEKQSFG